MTLERAIEIAAWAHRGQTDKNGAPYILHPLRVMLACPEGDAQIAGVLHDVVEDTIVTLDDLRREGFSGAVVAAIDSVTRRAGEDYMEVIERAKADPIGRVVKLADLADNTGRPGASESLMRRYEKAVDVLRRPSPASEGDGR